MIAPWLLALTLTGSPSRTVDEDFAAPIDISADQVADALKAEVAHALLGDAMLSLDDLTEGWQTDDSGEDCESLFSGTEYQPLFIAQVQVRFERRRTGEFLDQQVGILPQWVLRHFADELESAGEDGGFSEQLPEASLTGVPALGDQSLGVHVAPEGALGAPGVEAIFLRRGSLVMALAYAQAAGRPLDLGKAARLALLADRKLSGVAQALEA